MQIPFYFERMETENCLMVVNLFYIQQFFTKLFKKLPKKLMRCRYTKIQNGVFQKNFSIFLLPQLVHWH